LCEKVPEKFKQGMNSSFTVNIPQAVAGPVGTKTKGGWGAYDSCGAVGGCLGWDCDENLIVSYELSANRGGTWRVRSRLAMSSVDGDLAATKRSGQKKNTVGNEEKKEWVGHRKSKTSHSEKERYK